MQQALVVHDLHSALCVAAEQMALHHCSIACASARASARNCVRQLLTEHSVAFHAPRGARMHATVSDRAAETHLDSELGAVSEVFMVHVSWCTELNVVFIVVCDCVGVLR